MTIKTVDLETVCGVTTSAGKYAAGICLLQANQCGADSS